MSKTKEEKKVSYVCALYGGIFRQSVVRFTATEKLPAEDCEQYKSLYGSDVKARYVKTKVSSAEAFKTLKDHLALQDNNGHLNDDLYGLAILKALKLMKDALQVKKSFTWNVAGESDEGEESGGEADESTEKNQPAAAAATPAAQPAQAAPAKKVLVKGKKQEPKAIDVEQEEEVVEAAPVVAPVVNTNTNTNASNKKAPAKNANANANTNTNSKKAPVAKK